MNYYRSTNEDITRWTEVNVEKWLCNKHRVRIGICGAFRNKWKVNGEKLLKLTEFEIKQICRFAKANQGEIQKVVSLIQALQDQQRRGERVESLKRKRMQTKDQNGRPNKRARVNGDNSTSSSHRTKSYKSWYANKNKHNLSSSGTRWTEPELRQVWRLWLECKEFEKVARMMNRTYLSILTRVNLIRRAISESNDEEFVNNLHNIATCKYSLLAIIKEQDMKEKEKSQTERLADNGLEEKLEYTEDEGDEEEEESESSDDDEPILALNINNRNVQNTMNNEVESNNDNVENEGNMMQNQMMNRRKKRFIGSDSETDDQ